MLGNGCAEPGVMLDHHDGGGVWVVQDWMQILLTVSASVHCLFLFISSLVLFFFLCH